MWSRFVVPLNRNFAPNSLVYMLNRNIHRSASMQGLKSTVTGVTVKKDTNDQNHVKQLKTIPGPFLDEPVDGTLLASDDPEVFGAINKRYVEPDVIDEGDIADDQHYSNIPLRRNQLPQQRYQQMIQKHIRNKQLKEAIDILEVRMKEDRVQPDYYIYELLIIECGRIGYTKKAFQLYNAMKKRGLRVSNPIYAALFNAISNTIHPDAGLKLAQDLRKKLIQNGYAANEIIYNNMIKAFGRCGDITTAFELVDEMKEKKLRLQVYTINHLLQVCCSDKEYGFRHALYIWHKMYRRRLTPTVHSFNLMARCTRDCGIGDIDEMQQVIGTILSNSKAYVKLRESRKKEVLLVEGKPTTLINETEHKDSKSVDNADSNSPSESGEIKDDCNQLPNLLSNLPHLGSIVQLSMVNTPEDRLMLLGGLPAFITQMESTKVRPNVKTFSLLMDVIPSTSEAEHDLIQQMRHMRVRADIDFFNLLMKRRILREDYDGAKQVLDMVKKVNLRPDIATYGVMAMGCVNRQQAQDFQQKLQEKGIKMNSVIVETLLKNATCRKDYDYVIYMLKHAMNEDIKPTFNFTEIVRRFKNSCFNSLKKEPNGAEQSKFNAFYVVYKNWQKQMDLQGLGRDDVSKLLNVHPWRQFKETEATGIEDIKNKRTRRYWKVQHALIKLTPARLDRLQSDTPNNTEDETDSAEKVDDK